MHRLNCDDCGSIIDIFGANFIELANGDTLCLNCCNKYIDQWRGGITSRNRTNTELVHEIITALSVRKSQQLLEHYDIVCERCDSMAVMTDSGWFTCPNKCVKLVDPGELEKQERFGGLFMRIRK